ncbi:MAG: hypothetical protein VXZ92_04380, partial [SAR324 cluster bacterium]|nr:hypothetical protein [SAR324 cluster bacterium]
LEKYPDSRDFLEPHWEGSDLLRTINDFKRQYGFFRKKNSPAEILAQKACREFRADTTRLSLYSSNEFFNSPLLKRAPMIRYEPREALSNTYQTV